MYLFMHSAKAYYWDDIAFHVKIYILRYKLAVKEFILCTVCMNIVEEILCPLFVFFCSNHRSFTNIFSFPAIRAEIWAVIVSYEY